MSEEAVEPSEAAEAEVEATTEEAPPPPDFSAQFAAIARKEAAFRSKQEGSKKLESQLAEMQKKLESYESRSSLAKSNPVEFLKQAGVNMSDLLHQDINGEVPVESVLSQKLEAQERRIQELVEAAERKEKAAGEAKESAEWNKFVDQVSNFVDNDTRYELIRAGGLQWMVPQLMKDYYDNQGQEVTAQQAADIVEESLEESLESYFKADKLKKKFGLSEPPPESQESRVDDAVEASSEKPKRKTKTLTNQLAQGTGERDTGMLSREESLDRIARMLESSS